MIAKSTNIQSKGMPRLLTKDPILDVVCEFRFLPTQADAGDLLPGLLFHELRSTLPNMRRLPSAELPKVVRNMQPELQYAPHTEFSGSSGRLFLGDRSLGIGLQKGYPGWKDFRSLAHLTWSAALGTGLIESVERLSVKYVNMLEQPEGSLATDLVRLNVQLGDRVVGGNSVQLRVEIPIENHIAVVSIINPAKAQENGGLVREGVVLDIDVVRLGPFINFQQDFETLLDEAHRVEKEVFYSLLTDKGLNQCEPIYD